MKAINIIIHAYFIKTQTLPTVLQMPYHIIVYNNQVHAQLVLIVNTTTEYVNCLDNTVSWFWRVINVKQRLTKLTKVFNYLSIIIWVILSIINGLIHGVGVLEFR